MPMDRCETCYWWGIAGSGRYHHDLPRGPFPDEKPAQPCKRFPPTGLWGATEESQQRHRVGSSLNTFHDDFCGEWRKRC